jgi:DNA-binding response OmpR family regulator
MERVYKIATTPLPLTGARVLVVEDDFLIAMELSDLLRDAGAQIVGPSRDLTSALALAEEPGLSAAVLDMQLGDTTSQPVARRLAARGIPFFFYTGQAETDPLRAEWPDCRIVSKPALAQSLVDAVLALVDN